MTFSGGGEVVEMNSFDKLSPNHSPLQPHACFNTPNNVTRWEYFSGVLDYKFLYLIKDFLYIVTLWSQPNVRSRVYFFSTELVLMP